MGALWNTSHNRPSRKYYLLNELEVSVLAIGGHLDKHLRVFLLTTPSWKTVSTWDSQELFETLAAFAPLQNPLISIDFEQTSVFGPKWAVGGWVGWQNRQQNRSPAHPRRFPIPDLDFVSSYTQSSPWSPFANDADLWLEEFEFWIRKNLTAITWIQVI